MSHVLDFLEAYKNLDEMCKQILSSERGVSQYIEEMETATRGSRLCVDWDNDYQQLKKMRYVRNKLVHEPNSFELNLFTEEDVTWVKGFRERIFNQTDPIALLYKATYKKNNESTQCIQNIKPVQNIYNNSYVNTAYEKDLHKGTAKVNWMLLGLAGLAVLLLVALLVISLT